MIDWKQIDTVFLDMDGTLLDLHYDNHFWLTHLPIRLAEIKGLDKEQVQNQLHAMYQRHHGSLDWYCLDFWTNELDIDIASLKHEVADRIGYRPNAKAFLKGLHEHGYRVVLVTNAHRGVIELKFQYTDLKEFLHDIVCSHDYRAPKEDQAFWNALQKDKPFCRQSTVFFDDNHSVLEAARNCRHEGT